MEIPAGEMPTFPARLADCGDALDRWVRFLRHARVLEAASLPEGRAWSAMSLSRLKALVAELRQALAERR